MDTTTTAPKPAPTRRRTAWFGGKRLRAGGWRVPVSAGDAVLIAPFLLTAAVMFPTWQLHSECCFRYLVPYLPWEVPAVKVDAEGQKVEGQVGYRAGTLRAYPESRERLPVHDPVERCWRHLDTCQFETVLVCRLPRRRLADGKVWTEP